MNDNHEHNQIRRNGMPTPIMPRASTILLPPLRPPNPRGAWVMSGRNSASLLPPPGRRSLKVGGMPTTDRDTACAPSGSVNLLKSTTKHRGYWTPLHTRTCGRFVLCHGVPPSQTAGPVSAPFLRVPVLLPRAPRDRAGERQRRRCGGRVGRQYAPKVCQSVTFPFIQGHPPA